MGAVMTSMADELRNHLNRDHMGKCVENVLKYSFNFVCTFNTYILEKCPMNCIFGVERVCLINCLKPIRFVDYTTSCRYGPNKVRQIKTNETV